MTLSRLRKRLVVGITSALLLFCHTVMAAQACGLAAAVAGGSAATETCHDLDLQSGEVPLTQEQNCPTEFAPVSLAKLDMPQGDVAGAQAHAIWLQFPVLAGLKPLALPARGEPPPLTIVHCRLRN